MYGDIPRSINCINSTSLLDSCELIPAVNSIHAELSLPTALHFLPCLQGDVSTKPPSHWLSSACLWPILFGLISAGLGFCDAWNPIAIAWSFLMWISCVRLWPDLFGFFHVTSGPCQSGIFSLGPILCASRLVHICLWNDKTGKSLANAGSHSSWSFHIAALVCTFGLLCARLRPRSPWIHASPVGLRLRRSRLVAQKSYVSWILFTDVRNCMSRAFPIRLRLHLHGQFVLS